MFGIASFRGRERLLGNTNISKDIQKHLNQPTQLSNKIQVGALSWPIYIHNYLLTELPIQIGFDGALRLVQDLLQCLG